MPNVADAGPRLVPNPGSGVVSYNPASGSEELPGRATAALGETVVQIANHEQDLLNTTRAEDAWNQYKNSAMELSVGNDGFMNKKGGDAVNGNLYKDYTGKLAESKKAIEEKLVTADQKRKFNERANVTDLQYKDHILRHYSEQRMEYEKTTFAGSVAAAESLVSAAPLDQLAFDTAKHNLDQRVDALLKLQGITDKGAIDAAKNKINDGLIVKRVDALLYTNPVAAESLFRLVQKDIVNPELRLQMQAKVREVSLGVRTTNDADTLIAEVRTKAAPGVSANIAPGSKEESLRLIDAGLKQNPNDESLIQAKYAIQQTDEKGVYESNTSGLPNTRDLRAQLPVILSRVESKADSIYGPDKGNPDRAAYVARLTNEIKGKIALEVTQLDAIQKESQGKLIDAIAGFGGGAPITNFSQIQANPDLMRVWQLTDPAAKVGLTRLMEHNLAANQKGNDTLYWEAFNRIHLEPGDPKKIDFYQQVLEFAGPGKLNTHQISQLRLEIDRAETPGGRSVNQLMKGSAAKVEQYFKTNMMFTAQPEKQIAATMRWTEEAGKKIDEYVKAKKDVRSLFQLDTPDSIVSPKFLETFVNSTPKDGLAAQAAAVTAAPVTMPTTIKSKEAAEAWFQSLPQMATTFVGPDGKTRLIPGRQAAPTAAEPTAPAGTISLDKDGNVVTIPATAAASAPARAPVAAPVDDYELVTAKKRDLETVRAERGNARAERVWGLVQAGKNILGLHGELTNAISKLFDNPQEADAAVVRNLIKTRKVTAEMEPYIQGALDGGQLTAQEQAEAQKMLQRIKGKK